MFFREQSSSKKTNFKKEYNAIYKERARLYKEKDNLKGRIGALELEVEAANKNYKDAVAFKASMQSKYAALEEKFVEMERDFRESNCLYNLVRDLTREVGIDKLRDEVSTATVEIEALERKLRDYEMENVAAFIETEVKRKRELMMERGPDMDGDQSWSQEANLTDGESLVRLITHMSDQDEATDSE